MHADITNTAKLAQPIKINENLKKFAPFGDFYISVKQIATEWKEEEIKV